MPRQCFLSAFNVIAIFLFSNVTRLYPYYYVLTKDAPGGDLIRVDLIRFPGSIPGDI